MSNPPPEAPRVPNNTQSPLTALVADAHDRGWHRVSSEFRSAILRYMESDDETEITTFRTTLDDLTTDVLRHTREMLVDSPFRSYYANELALLGWLAFAPMEAIRRVHVSCVDEQSFKFILVSDPDQGPLQIEKLSRILEWGGYPSCDDRIIQGVIDEHCARWCAMRAQTWLSATRRMLKLRHCPLLEKELQISAPVNSGGQPLELFVRDCLRDRGLKCNHAPLDEDLLEGTDLRLQMPDLERKRGVRIQVTWLSNLDAIKKKRFLIPYAGTVVILSPFTLARFQAGRADYGPEYTNELIAVDEQAAFEIKQRLSSALAHQPSHPLGPAITAPSELRELIGEYVETEAKCCHARLRERQTERPSYGSFGAWTRSLTIQDIDEKNKARGTSLDEGGTCEDS